MGVITGLMGSEKTTILYHLFGLPPSDLYTSTGVAEQSFRSLLHHTLHRSAGTWERLSHRDIRELLANLITAGISESNVNPLASRLIHDINQDTGNVPTNPLDSAPSPPLTVASVLSKIKAFVPLRRPQSPTSTVGARLKMSQEKVVAALVLFHRQNTFLYFRDVLPNHVFIKPQVPLDIINSIVAFNYKKLQGVPAKLVSQLENGIVTEKL